MCSKNHAKEGWCSEMLIMKVLDVIFVNNLQFFCHDSIAIGERISEDEVKVQLHNLVEFSTVNTTSRFVALKWQLSAKGCISISLCRMLFLQVVRPFLKNDVQQIASYFIKCGYIEGNGFFYVAIEDNNGFTTKVADEIVEKWSPQWRKRNKEFDMALQSEEDFKVFSNKMFMV